ncbi:Hypothetical protein PHPALM_12735 [Phytophthora palmivora]|uniref:Elicitin n=1 Tax=Phytophthora palmivora TaxID=4796 RepID=A0A2P4XYZ0_9STRA|nr:Hypothetical protein PHPALM_12735 [Phytophthora palmivora]
MKTSLLSALILLGALGITVTAEGVCDLESIHTALATDVKTKTKLAASEEKCLEDTDYDIFDVSSFPTLAQAKDAQASEDCSVLINLVNGNANVASQCTIEVNGTQVIYGHLISSFLNGKTGNESDSGSDSAGVSASASESESESGSNSSSASASTSSSSTTALSFVTYGAIAAIAVALLLPL